MKATKILRDAALSQAVELFQNLPKHLGLPGDPFSCQTAHSAARRSAYSATSN